jgi:hypothetical protein
VLFRFWILDSEVAFRIVRGTDCSSIQIQISNLRFEIFEDPKIGRPDVQ